MWNWKQKIAIKFLNYENEPLIWCRLGFLCAVAGELWDFESRKYVEMVIGRLMIWFDLSKRTDTENKKKQLIDSDGPKNKHRFVLHFFVSYPSAYCRKPNKPIPEWDEDKWNREKKKRKNIYGFCDFDFSRWCASPSDTNWIKRNDKLRTTHTNCVWPSEWDCIKFRWIPKWFRLFDVMRDRDRKTVGEFAYHRFTIESKFDAHLKLTAACSLPMPTQQLLPSLDFFLFFFFSFFEFECARDLLKDRMK